MSRCYPYPPPGYEKKAYVELGFSPKKEKHKHKDKDKEKKKKKKRKDRETNGDASRDADKLSKKAHETGVLNDGLSLPNGRTTVISSEAVGEKHSRAVPVADRPNSSVLSASVLAINCKELGGVNVQESQLPVVSIKAASSRNGEAAKAEAESSSKAALKFEPESSRLYHFSPHVEKVWSEVDDQEWLFPRDIRVPKVKSEARDAPQAWEEAVFLPSVGIYALPYVVPD